MPDQNQERKNNGRKFSELFYNPITYLGIFIALGIFVVEVFLFFYDFYTAGSNIYLGIITYVFLPAILIIGLLLIPIGALWEQRRRNRGLPDTKFKKIYINLAKASHRNAFFIFLLGTILLFIMSAIGSYKAYQYTESVHFCGITCHQVMKPEFMTYQNSPHARVKCVECHIGEGADWYVKAKISGVRQVYHTIKGDYARPIKTPVHNLRPAEETCQKCHWPSKSYSSYELDKTYYSTYNPDQPPWIVRMLIHVGKGQNANTGIHNHMYLDHDIYYVADDEKRQQISWIKSVDKNGKEEIFLSEDSPWKDKTPPPDAIRKMDCIDCHNRPTHHFRSPQYLMNEAISLKRISISLPSIKEKAMELLSKEYKTEKEAVDSIRTEMVKHYRDVFKEEYGQHEQEIENNINELVNIFKTNFFPEMKARWDAFPDNIGHFTSKGCFRCHDGTHYSTQDQQVITKDCQTCHTIIEQGPVGSLQRDTQGLPFVHPFEDDGLWQEMSCFDCHTGN